MTSVCFTGKGYTDTNSTQPQLRTRSVWSSMAKAMGWNVQTAVNSATDVLVASRTNTVKANDARRWGARAITYEMFQAEYDAAVKTIADRGVSTTGVDLTDPNDDGTLGYDPLEAQQAAYAAAQRASNRLDRAEELKAKRVREAAERERQEAEARRIADEEAIPGWGQF